MRKIYRIQSKDLNLITENREALKRTEYICRGKKQDYTIVFPDGHKLIAKFEGT